LGQVIFGPALRHIATVYGKTVLPPLSGTLNVTGLTAPVEILRDEYGVQDIIVLID